MTVADDALSRLAEARRRGDAVSMLATGAGTVIVIADTGERDNAADLVPVVPDAARIAATSPRVLRDAIRGGELVAYGNQRDRAVRRDDLQRWIESRKVTHASVDDVDIDRRVARLGKLRAVGGGR